MTTEPTLGTTLMGLTPPVEATPVEASPVVVPIPAEPSQVDLTPSVPVLNAPVGEPATEVPAPDTAVTPVMPDLGSVQAALEVFRQVENYLANQG